MAISTLMVPVVVGSEVDILLLIVSDFWRIENLDVMRSRARSGDGAAALSSCPRPLTACDLVAFCRWRTHARRSGDAQNLC